LEEDGPCACLKKLIIQLIYDKTIFKLRVSLRIVILSTLYLVGTLARGNKSDLAAGEGLAAAYS
jgi:hypothetical protein